MKFLIDGEEVYSLSETQQKVIQNDIPDNVFLEDMKRRVQWVIYEKYKNCMKRLKEEWEPKLKDAGVEAFPVDEERFAQLIFSQPNYKSRSQRDAEKSSGKLS